MGPGHPVWEREKDPRVRFRLLGEAIQAESPPMKPLPDFTRLEQLYAAREAYRAACLKVLGESEWRPWDAANNISVSEDALGRAKRYQRRQIQRYIAKWIDERRNRRIWAAIWKSRQLGVTTEIAAQIYQGVTRGHGQRALITAQSDPDSLVIFEEKYKLLHKLDPLAPRAARSNTTELLFPDISGHIRIRTAGGRKSAGRGGNVRYFHACLSGEAPILLSNGKIARIRDVAIGDEVVTHLGNKASVSFTSTKEDECLAIRVRKTAGIPLVATKSHRFLTPSGWKLASDLISGDELGFPCPGFDEAKQISSLPFKLTKENPKRRGEKVNAPAEVQLSFALGRIVGLYLAEGMLRPQRDYESHLSRIVFSVHRREVPRTIEWLNCVRELYTGLAYTDRKTSLTSTVEVSGRSFPHWIDAMVCRKDDKRMPLDWRKYPSEFVRGIIHGYIAGDGHCRKGERGISVCSTRSATILPLREMLLACGYGWASLSNLPAGVRNGRNEQEQWRLVISGPAADRLAAELGWSTPTRKRTVRGVTKWRYDGTHVWVPIEKIEPAGKRQVFDLEIDHDDHSYCLPHGASHNSEAAWYDGNPYTFIGGILGGMTHPQSMAFLESTGNGMSGFFFEKVLEAWNAEVARREGRVPEVATQWEPIFLPFFMDDEAKKGIPFESEEQREQFKKSMRDDEKLIQQEEQLADEVMHWYRMIFDTKAQGETEDAKLMWILQEFPTKPMDAFQAPGSCAFDSPRLVSLTLIAKPPLWVGDMLVPGQREGKVPLYDTKAGEYLTATPKPVLVKNSKGKLRIWQMPKAGRRYQIGADFAESGGAKSDFTEFYVLDYDTEEICANFILKSPDPLEPFTPLRLLSVLYNDAMINPEANRGKHLIALLAKTDRKDRLYVRMSSKVEAGVLRWSKNYGFEMRQNTKPPLVDLTREKLATKPHLFIDKHLLDQMKTFRQERTDLGEWRYPGALPGSGNHDDGIDAFMLALRGIQDMPHKAPAPRAEEKTKLVDSRGRPLASVSVGDKMKGHVEYEQSQRDEGADGWS